jgi:hypothetical protein
MDIKKYNKQYYKINKEKIQENHKLYYENNKQILTEKQKDYYENNKGNIIKKQKDYRENNKDKIKEYVENNKDKILEYQKEYREMNKDKILEYQKEYQKEYRENNKEKIKEKMKCKSCKLFSVGKPPYLCSYCNPDKTTRQKTKELKVKTFLEEHGYTFIHNKKCNLDNSCQTYYPDFLIDCNTFFLIIECDEDAHKSYDKDCEKIRENNICFALGLPCVFIRFNPDKKGIKMKVKEKILKSYINYYMNKEHCDNEVCYLFY